VTISNVAHRTLGAQSLNRRALLCKALAAGLTAPALAALISSRVSDVRAADRLTEDLDAMLAAALEQGLPGIALQVERGGEVLYSGAAGLASVEQETPLTLEHRFRLGSVAKASTATVVLQMVDAGALSLDDPVSTWLDDPAVLRIPKVDRVTVRQLLNHTSGIYDFADETDSPLWAVYLGENPDWSKVWTLPELLAFADGASHPPYFAPGESFHYSNTGYVLLGLIVEQATGHRLADEVRDRVLNPLDLHDTFLAEGATIPEGTADCYHNLGGSLVNTTEINLSWTWGCGWTVSTLADFARFGRAVLDGELLSPESAAEMFAFVPDPNFDALGWGMGVWSQPTSHGQVVGCGGDGPGFTANLARLPEEDLTVVVVLNSAGLEFGTGQIRDEAMSAVIGAA
jgi:D-alanyl-D-alanine carboxypeptidase